MPAPYPRMHGVSHVPGGPDPIPGLTFGGAEPAEAYADRVAALGNLVSYWKMDAASGNMLDYAANPAGDEPLILQAGTTGGTYQVTGAGAVVANGDDDGAWQGNANQSTNTVLLNTADYFLASDATNQRWSFNSVDPFTVSLFIRWTSGWLAPGNLVFIGTDPGSGVPAGWSMTMFGGATSIAGAIRVYRGESGVQVALTTPALPADTWVHVAQVFTGTSLRLYLDGALAAVTATTQGVTTRNDIYVGAGIYNAAATRGHLYGALDEIAVFDRALTGGEVGGLAALAADALALGGVVTVTGAYTATEADSVILTSGTLTVTLPTAVGISGKEYTIKSISGTATVAQTGSEQIDGSATDLTLAAQDSVRLISDGTNWRILSSYSYP